jgi:hypothetical protein
MNLEARRLDRRDPAGQRLGAGGTVADMAHAGRVVARQLQRVELVVVPGAQIGAVPLLRRQLQPVDAGVEIEAFLERSV